MGVRVILSMIQQILTEHPSRARDGARSHEYHAKQGTLFILVRERKIKKASWYLIKQDIFGEQ